MVLKMPKIEVFADAYMNNPQRWGPGSLEYCDPVDMNGGFVALSKYDPKNLKRTEENIQHRFRLDDVDTDDDE